MVLADDLSRFVGAGEWLAEYGSTRRVSWHCCWEKVWRELVIVIEVSECVIMHWIG